MPESIVENPEDGQHLWEKHLQDGYCGLPKRKKYAKAVRKAVYSKINNKRESISILYHRLIQETKEYPLSVEVKEKYQQQPDDISEINPFETDYLLQSHQITDCSKCERSGSYCDNCYNSGTKVCPESKCDDGIIKVDCECDYGNIESTCQACGGSGYSIQEQCRQCDGTKKYVDQYGKEKKCHKCDREGIYTKICNECQNGTVEEECPKCQGAGILTKGQCNTCSQYSNTKSGRIACSKCENQTIDVVCSNCEGEGEVIEAILNKIVNESTEIKNKEQNFEDKHLSQIDNLEYTAEQDTTFDTLKELEMHRSEDIEDELPDNIFDTDVENIDRIDYRYETTQSIKRYAYNHTDKIYTLRNNSHHKITDPSTYYFKKVDGVPRVASLEITENGELIDKMDTGFFVYGSWLKCAIINLSSEYEVPTLSYSQKIAGIIPSIPLRIYKKGIISSGLLIWGFSIFASIPGYFTFIFFSEVLGVVSLFGVQGGAYLYSIVGLYTFITYVFYELLSGTDPTPNIKSKLKRN